MATADDLQNKHPLPCIGDRMLVTLRSPVVVMLQGQPRSVPSFEGELCNQSDRMAVFATMRMFAKSREAGASAGVKHETITMRTDLTVPLDNLAGMLPLPKAS
jgi:hypothetical protein